MSAEAPFILFLGAGASRRFGLPTSEELLRKIENRFPLFRPRIKRILKRAERAGFKPNLETLLGVLDSAADPQKAMQIMGPFASAISDPVKISRMKPNKRDGDISDQIKDYILRPYFVNNATVVDNIRKTYDDFFRGLKDRFALTPLNPANDAYPSLEIFTTNFDNVIEIFGKETGTPVFNGYYYDQALGWCYDHQKFTDGSMTNSIRLFKMHGTVTHVGYSVGRQIDEVTSLPKKGRLQIRGRPALPRLTYPGAYHYFSEEPKLELLYLLKRKLTFARRCLVIGYSFGDPNIAQVFTDCIELNSSLKIALISRKAESRIGDTRYNPERVRPIRSKFEDVDIRSLNWS